MDALHTHGMHEPDHRIKYMQTQVHQRTVNTRLNSDSDEMSLYSLWWDTLQRLAVEPACLG
jgi:hypothetical protein